MLLSQVKDKQDDLDDLDKKKKKNINSRVNTSKKMEDK